LMCKPLTSIGKKYFGNQWASQLFGYGILQNILIYVLQNYVTHTGLEQ